VAFNYQAIPLITALLVADPGTKFDYGINADWLPSSGPV
jgi:hypothetical protein